MKYSQTECLHSITPPSSGWESCAWPLLLLLVEKEKGENLKSRVTLQQRAEEGEEEQTTERRGASKQNLPQHTSPLLALTPLPDCTSPLGPESRPNLIHSQAGAGQLTQLSHIFNRFHQA